MKYWYSFSSEKFLYVQQQVVAKRKKSGGYCWCMCWRNFMSMANPVVIFGLLDVNCSLTRFAVCRWSRRTLTSVLPYLTLNLRHHFPPGGSTSGHFFLNNDTDCTEPHWRTHCLVHSILAGTKWSVKPKRRKSTLIRADANIYKRAFNKTNSDWRKNLSHLSDFFLYFLRHIQK